nr:MAG TPA: hypothetical protein [Caudoviricetes sp.]
MFYQSSKTPNQFPLIIKGPDLMLWARIVIFFHRAFGPAGLIWPPASPFSFSFHHFLPFNAK